MNDIDEHRERKRGEDNTDAARDADLGLRGVAFLFGIECRAEKPFEMRVGCCLL